MRASFTLFIITGLSTPACQIADKDRCPDYLVWSSSYKSCVPIAEDDTDSDTTNGTDSETDGGVSGLGNECVDQPDCAPYDADYCAINPLTPNDPGYCTIFDCVAGDCPGDYQCCDCTEQGADAAVCMNADDAAAAIGFGCSCS